MAGPQGPLAGVVVVVVVVGDEMRRSKNGTESFTHRHYAARLNGGDRVA